MDFIEILKDINGRFEKLMKIPHNGRFPEAHFGGPPEEPEEPESYEEWKERRACEGRRKGGEDETTGMA